MTSDEVIVSGRGLTKVYTKGARRVEALLNVDIDIRRQSMTAIMGASGSGKSTLLHILGTLSRPTAGVLEICGHRTDQLGRRALADLRNRVMGFVFQDFHLFERKTALENVALALEPRHISRREAIRLAEQALGQVGLLPRMNHRPSELSGGQQQRVAIARALVLNPAIIFADEPTGALDEKTSASILSLLQKISHQDRAVLIVSHDPAVRDYASHIVKMRDGRLLKDGACS